MLETTTSEAGAGFSALAQLLQPPGMDTETTVMTDASAKPASVRRVPSVPLASQIARAQCRLHKTLPSGMPIIKAKLSSPMPRRGSPILDFDLPRVTPGIPGDSSLVEARLRQRRVRRVSKWDSKLQSEIPR